VSCAVQPLLPRPLNRRLSASKDGRHCRERSKSGVLGSDSPGGLRTLFRRDPPVQIRSRALTEFSSTARKRGREQGRFEPGESQRPSEARPTVSTRFKSGPAHSSPPTTTSTIFYEIFNQTVADRQWPVATRFPSSSPGERSRRGVLETRRPRAPVPPRRPLDV